MYFQINHLPWIERLFGFNKKERSWVAYGGPITSNNNDCKEFDSFVKKVISSAKKQKIQSVQFRALPPLRNWQINLEEIVILG